MVTSSFKLGIGIIWPLNFPASSATDGLDGEFFWKNKNWVKKNNTIKQHYTIKEIQLFKRLNPNILISRCHYNGYNYRKAATLGAFPEKN